MHLLLVAPDAPPKNSPEAIQVGRFLATLDPEVRVTMLTTPVTVGWVSEDKTLEIARPGLRVITMALPFHRLTQRLLANHRLQSCHIPDDTYWLPALTRSFAKQLDSLPDVIYSRSSPFSAALLALKLKERLRCPWLMHLSDPWAGSPYRAMPPKRANADLALEAACFASADCITLTTQGQAAHYRARYPDRATAISVSPNMMPLPEGGAPITLVKTAGEQFRLVYTGALYKGRDPATILRALRLLHDQAPEEAKAISVRFYGNMLAEYASEISRTPGCEIHGRVNFEVASQAQREADAVLTIEPAGENPLLLHFMPSKTLDYIAYYKPIVAITPPGSETARLCNKGYGWIIEPGDAEALATLLVSLVKDRRLNKPLVIAPENLTERYGARQVTEGIMQLMRTLQSNSSVGSAVG